MSSSDPRLCLAQACSRSSAAFPLN
jgi:hypothetical protein